MPKLNFPLGFNNGVIVAIFLWLIAIALLAFFPEIDIWVSNYFYHDEFSYRNESILVAFRLSGQWGARLIGVLLLLAIIVCLFSPKRRSHLKGLCVAFAGFAVGAALIVDTIVKPIFARPRPYSVNIFGGTEEFSPVLKISHLCQSNCSFPSGEAAAAAAFIGFIFLLPRKYHSLLWIVVILWTILLSMLRVSFGGHFLSDVITSWIIVYLTIWMAARIFKAGISDNDEHLGKNQST